MLINSVSNTIDAKRYFRTICVYMIEITLSEFDRNKKFTVKALCLRRRLSLRCHFWSKFLSNIGIDIRFTDKPMYWINGINVVVEMRDNQTMRVQHNNDKMDFERRDSFVATILDIKCEGASPDKVAEQQKHLTITQRGDIRRLVAKYPKLFSTALLKYPYRKIHLGLEPNATPRHVRPYSVVYAHLDVFRKDLQRFVDIRVLRTCGATKRASWTMVISKKDKTI